jgi:hypothetical protein
MEHSGRFLASDLALPGSRHPAGFWWCSTRSGIPFAKLRIAGIFPKTTAQEKSPAVTAGLFVFERLRC